jgi:serine/threonine protein kinase
MPQAIRLQIDTKTLAIMHCVDAFERSHASGPSDLRQFLGEVPGEHRLEALSELVRVDFERESQRGERPSVVRYLDEYPELRGSSASVIELLQIEFSMRQRAGEQPSADDFRRVHADFKPPADTETNQSALITAPFSDQDVRLAPAAAPERVGKYRIVRQLGAGGFGVVYQAYDEQLERSVAIKIRHGDSGPSGLSDDLLHEARSIAQLDHPGIVRLLEAGETEQGVGYVVYEYIEGETLEVILGRHDYDRAQAVEWVAQVAEALHYAHQRRIVHRDVKPGNILLDAARRPKVVDFGLARRDDQFFRDDSGLIVGTLAYLSPEQASGDSNWASSQSDLYSLGVILYEVLCQKRPFQAKRTGEMLDQVLHRSPAPPRSFDDTISIPLEDACLKALARQPAARFKTGSDMASAVRAAMRPPTSLLPLVARYAAALAAVSALCVLIISLWMPAAAVSAPSMPEISSYNLLFADTETPVNNRLPLGSGAQLKVEATFSSPAYAYLIVFDQQAPARLIWPAKQNLPRQRPIPQLIYPPLTGAVDALSVPDADGAMFVVALACREPLTDRALSELLATRLLLNISPEIAAQARTCFQVAEPTPKIHRGIPTRSGGREKATDLRIQDSFKRALRSHSDAYFGDLVPHSKAADPAAN